MNSPKAALVRAQVCLASGDGPQAVRIMQSAVAQAPDHVALQTGLGVASRFIGKLDDAAAAFLRALALEPGKADAQVYLGMIRLAQGRQQEGWPLYQARWRNVHWTDRLRYPEATLWRGRVTPGLRLLLWGEQGLGDTIQFCRYAPWLLRKLRSHGGSLALEVPAALSALLRTSWPFMEIFDQGEVRGRFDAHVPLMDLPHLWGDSVGQAGIPYQPMPVPYLSVLQSWGTGPALPAITPRPLRVGIAWQGRPTHPDDRFRSVPLDALSGLFEAPGVQWVSLQKDGKAHPSWLARDVAVCRDFADTARLVEGLDLVISVDSAVAHLAGALGKPVWLLLPKVADWRWQLSGQDTPWYPSMRLFRQQQSDAGWGAVLIRVMHALRQ